ncbi:MAG: XRE family transcriptional regulator [Mesorhizobium sp.]
MDSLNDDLTRRIGTRVAQRRSEAGISLDDLAARTNVSRAMISRIERGEVNASAVVLDRLCDGLAMTLSQLFARADAASPLARFAEQPVWRDPASGYLRRTVSPPDRGSAVAIAEIEFPAGASVTLQPSHHRFMDQHVWCLAGQMEITLGVETHRLMQGDCLHMRPEPGIRFANRSGSAARYAVILSMETRP